MTEEVLRAHVKHLREENNRQKVIICALVITIIVVNVGQYKFSRSVREWQNVTVGGVSSLGQAETPQADQNHQATK